MITTLIVTLTTCVSLNTGNFVQGKSIERLKERSIEVLNYAKDEFDPAKDNFPALFDIERVNQDLQLLLLDSIAKSKFNNDFIDNNIRNQAVENKINLLNNPKFNPILNYRIDTSNGSLLFDSVWERISSSFVDTLNSTEYISNDIVLPDNHGHIIGHEINLNNNDQEYEEILDEIDQQIERQEENEPEYPQFPLIAGINSNSFNVNINGIVDNCRFLGFDFSPDWCASFYNVIASFLNLQIGKQVYGTNPTLTETIFKIIEYISGGVISKSALISLIVKFFSSIWTSLIATISACGPIAMIVTAIVIVAAGVVIGTIAAAFFAGSQHRGYRFGFIIRKWYHWEFVNEEYLL